MKLHTPQYIKQWLMEKGEGSIYDFYRWYRQYHPSISYTYIAQLFYYLRKLDLIRVVRREPSSRSPIPKAIYALNPQKIGDEAWNNPQKALREARG